MIITFDPKSGESIRNDTDLSELRMELTVTLDRILRHNRLGRWIGGKTAAGVTKILLYVEDQQEAVQHIESALAGHWISKHMKVQCLTQNSECRI